MDIWIFAETKVTKLIAEWAEKQHNDLTYRRLDKIPSVCTLWILTKVAHLFVFIGFTKWFDTQ